MRSTQRALAVLIVVFVISCSGRYTTTSVSTAECVTIDATVNDKALACMRGLHPGAPGHATIEKSAENLLDCTDTTDTKKTPVKLIGHGLAGFMITGGGKLLHNAKEYIAFSDNADQHWQPSYKPLDTTSGRDGMITLLSCHTGAGKNGAKLVHKMAQYLGRPVRARTGFTYCKASGVSFEAGSAWQEGDPNASDPSASIAPPVRPLRPRSNDIRLGGKVLNARLIEKVEVLNRVGETPSEWRTVPPAQAAALIAEIELDNPVSPGAPLAVETARLRITLPLIGVREFIIYNDLLLEYTALPDVYFHVRAEFPDLLQAALQN